MTLGTPGVKFMVALDTGSDLFWVPCECGRCASIDESLHSQVGFSFFLLMLAFVTVLT